MTESIDFMSNPEQEVTREDVIACFLAGGNESDQFKKLIATYAAQCETIAEQNTVAPGRANLECALHMAELHLATGHVDEAHDTFTELSEIALYEGAFDLVQRINGHLREHL
ncbi:MAG: hypothetical protein HZA80_02985 [Candidatus Taylorbacteria bacterium]|nr:hypothetical protein [Candidatus Taylorbacteria bacterium]